MIMIALLLPFLLFAENNEAKLGKIKKEIDATKKEVKQLTQKEKKIAGEISKMKKKTSASKKRLKKLGAEEEELDDTIDSLRTDVEQVTTEIKQREKAMARKARLMYLYTVSRKGLQSDPGRARTRFYVQQVLDQGRDEQSNLKETEAGLSARQEKEESKLAEVLEIKDKEQAQRDQVLAQTKKKKRSLQSVKKQKSEKSKRVKDLEKARTELEKLVAAVKKYPAKELGAVVWPVKGRITGRFGTVIDRELGTKLINKGIDIQAPYGTNVRAMSNGKVVYEGPFLGYAKIILLDHENGFCSLYCHLSEILVVEGDKIIKGDVIGRVGTGGLSEQSGLHFELRKNGVAVDPLKWFK
jgi:septal ring factor EnvC (AmiA/AmiB activator)